MGSKKNKKKSKGKGKGKDKARADTPSPSLAVRTRSIDAQDLSELERDSNNAGPSSGPHANQAANGARKKRRASSRDEDHVDDQPRQGSGLASNRANARVAITPSPRQGSSSSASLFTPANRRNVNTTPRSGGSGSGPAMSCGSSIGFGGVGRAVPGILASGGESSGGAVAAPGVDGFRSGRLSSKTGFDGVSEPPSAKRVKHEIDSPSIKRIESRVNKTAQALRKAQHDYVTQTMRDLLIRRGIDGFVTALAELYPEVQHGRDSYIRHLYKDGAALFRAGEREVERRAAAIVVGDDEDDEPQVISDDDGEEDGEEDGTDSEDDEYEDDEYDDDE